jgi:tetratricopeptide (TPR) repeat protein
MAALLAALDRDPTVRRRRAGFAASAMIACLAATGVYAHHRSALRARCDEGARIAAQTWSPRARADVYDGIVRSGVPFVEQTAQRVLQRFDDWVSRWATEYRVISEATLLAGSESSTVMQQRLACLESSRQEFASLATVFSHADAKMAPFALQAAFGLPEPSACSEEGARWMAIPPAEGHVHDQVERGKQVLAEARAHDLAGQKRETIDLVRSVLPDVRAIPNRRLEADLLMVLGRTLHHTADVSAAVDAFEQAYAAAEAAGVAPVSVQAASQLARLYALRREWREAHRALTIARAVLERLGPNDGIELDILQTESQVLRLEGHPESAMLLMDRIVELGTKVHGPWSLGLAAAFESRAICWGEMSEPDRSVAEFRRVIAIREQLMGADNPYMFRNYNNIGVALTNAGHFDEAEAALLRAVELSTPLGVAAAIPAASLAALYNQVGRSDRAAEAAGRGLATIESAGDDGSRWLLPWLLVQRGRARVTQGDASRGNEDCSRALAIQEKTGIAADSVYDPDALTCLGEAQLALGRREPAVAFLERSTALDRRTDPADLPLARFALARALLGSPSERTRARELARRALDGLRGLPGRNGDVATVERWLAENNGGVQD